MLTARDGSTQRTLWILAAIAFAVPLSLLAVSSLKLQPDEARRLAETDPARRLAEWHRQQFPDTDALLVTWDGSTIDDPRIASFSESLLGKVDADGILRGGAPEISAVTTPADMLQRMTAQGIAVEEATRRLSGTYIGIGGMKLKLTDAGRGAQEAVTHRLIKAVHDNVGVDLEVSGPVEAWETADADAAAPLPIPEHDLQITWAGFHPRSEIAPRVRSLALALTDFPTADEPNGRKLVDECFIAPGEPIAIHVALSAAGVADVPSAVQAIEQAATAAELPAVHVVGEPLTHVEQLRASERMLWNPTAAKLTQRSLLLLAAFVMTVLSGIMLRSYRAGVLLSALTMASILLSAAMLRGAGDSIDPVLAGVPMLAGLLMLACGMQILGNPAQERGSLFANRSSVASVRYATIVAAVVLMPLMVSSTPAVRQLGVFGVGAILVVLCLAVAMLPALLPMLGTSAKPNTGGWANLAVIITRRPRLTASLCLLVLLAGAAGAGRARLESGDQHAFPADSRLAADVPFVEDNLTGTTPLDVIVRFSPECRNGMRFLERAEIVRMAEQTVSEHPAIAGAYSLADLLPKTEILAADAPTRQRVLFNRKSNEAEEQVRSGAVPGAGALLQTADQNRDWQLAGDARLTRIDDELWLISTSARLPAEVDVPRVIQEIDASVKTVLRRFPGAEHVVSGPPIVNLATRQALLKSFAKTTGLACFVMFVAMIWLVRSPTAFLLGTLVNLLPAGCVVGFAALRGVRIDVSTMAAIVFAVTLGTHSAVQLLHRFKSAMDQGSSHADAARQALAEFGPGCWRFSIVSIGGLLALLPSEVAAVRQFAGLLASMIAATQLAVIVLLPALLAGRVGRWLQGVQRPRVTAMQEETHSPHVRFEPTALRDTVRNTV
ncbi:MAG: MMPL family transporter [Planctomycetaceae bacterium]|nr:MMPL family transporter [Planctomycetaceae bacterium]